MGYVSVIKRLEDGYYLIVPRDIHAFIEYQKKLYFYEEHGSYKKFISCLPFAELRVHETEPYIDRWFGSGILKDELVKIPDSNWVRDLKEGIADLEISYRNNIIKIYVKKE